MLLYVYIYFFCTFFCCCFSSKNLCFYYYFHFSYEVSNFRNRTLTNQKPELAMKNCQWNCGENTLNTVDHLMRYVIVHVLTSTKTYKRCSFVKCIPLLTYAPYVTNYSKTSINAINKIMNLCNSVLCKLYFLRVLSI